MVKKTEITPELLAQAHDIMYEMFCVIDDIFKRNNIRYFMGFGTLLGAVRHEGFIPWDDDIDLHVYDEDYDKAVKVLQKELDPQNYILHNKESDEKYWYTYARVRHLKSEAYFQDNYKEHIYKYQGLFITLVRTPQTKRLNRVPYKIIKETSNAKDFNRTQSGFVEKLKYICAIILYPIEKLIFNIIEILPGRKIRILGDFSWNRQHFAEEDIYPFCNLKFRDRYFPAPNDYKKVLQETYGDYMQLPKEENRRVHFDKIIIK